MSIITGKKLNKNWTQLEKFLEKEIAKGISINELEKKLNRKKISLTWWAKEGTTDYFHIDFQNLLDTPGMNGGLYLTDVKDRDTNIENYSIRYSSFIDDEEITI